MTLPFEEFRRRRSATTAWTERPVGPEFFATFAVERPGGVFTTVRTVDVVRLERGSALGTAPSIVVIRMTSTVGVRHRITPLDWISVSTVGRGAYGLCTVDFDVNIHRRIGRGFVRGSFGEYRFDFPGDDVVEGFVDRSVADGVRVRVGLQVSSKGVAHDLALRGVERFDGVHELVVRPERDLAHALSISTVTASYFNSPPMSDGRQSLWNGNP